MWENGGCIHYVVMETFDEKCHWCTVDLSPGERSTKVIAAVYSSVSCQCNWSLEHSYNLKPHVFLSFSVLSLGWWVGDGTVNSSAFHNEHLTMPYCYYELYAWCVFLMFLRVCGCFHVFLHWLLAVKSLYCPSSMSITIDIIHMSRVKSSS